MASTPTSLGSRNMLPGTAATRPVTPSSAGAPATRNNSLEGLPSARRPPLAPSSRLVQNHIQTNGMFFQTKADSMAFMGHAHWWPPPGDTSLPREDEDYRRVVQQLVNAFREMEYAKDTPNSVYRRRLAKGSSSYYSDWVIEACAWKILIMVETIHKEGFGIPIYDRELLDNIGQTQHWTFQQRIDWICKVLKTSKSVAVSLIKHEKVWTTIGAPHRLYHSAKVNSVSNGHRNAWVKAGREADEEHRMREAKRQRGNTYHSDNESNLTDLHSAIIDDSNKRKQFNKLPESRAEQLNSPLTESNLIHNARNATPTPTGSPQAKTAEMVHCGSSFTPLNARNRAHQLGDISGATAGMLSDGPPIKENIGAVDVKKCPGDDTENVGKSTVKEASNIDKLNAPNNASLGPYTADIDINSLNEETHEATSALALLRTSG